MQFQGEGVKKDRHVGIVNKDGARGFPGTVENGFLKFIGLRLAPIASMAGSLIVSKGCSKLA